LIEAKIAGQEIVAPPMANQVPIINLMDALRQSVEKMKGLEAPPKKMAPSKRPSREGRKRKSS
jgi:non-homologous end joining protein Ku